MYNELNDIVPDSSADLPNGELANVVCTYLNRVGFKKEYQYSFIRECEKVSLHFIVTPFNMFKATVLFRSEAGVWDRVFFVYNYEEIESLSHFVFLLKNVRKFTFKKLNKRPISP